MLGALLAWARCPVSTSLSLGVFKNHGHVALKEVVSGHGGDGLGMGLVISEFFSNLDDSMILQFRHPCSHILGCTFTLLLAAASVSLLSETRCVHCP